MSRTRPQGGLAEVNGATLQAAKRRRNPGTNAYDESSASETEHEDRVKRARADGSSSALAELPAAAGPFSNWVKPLPGMSEYLQPVSMDPGQSWGFSPYQAMIPPLGSVPSGMNPYSGYPIMNMPSHMGPAGMMYGMQVPSSYSGGGAPWMMQADGPADRSGSLSHAAAVTSSTNSYTHTAPQHMMPNMMYGYPYPSMYMMPPPHGMMSMHAMPSMPEQVNAPEPAGSDDAEQAIVPARRKMAFGPQRGDSEEAGQQSQQPRVRLPALPEHLKNARLIATATSAGLGLITTEDGTRVRGKMEIGERRKVDDFLEMVKAGSRIVRMGDLAKELREFVNPIRPLEFFEKLVSRRKLNVLLRPHLVRRWEPLRDGVPKIADAGPDVTSRESDATNALWEDAGGSADEQSTPSECSVGPAATTETVVVPAVGAPSA
jgi:hypothetical protein